MPKISVIIPVYNVEKYLSRCLDSVINQSFSDLEIICIDDDSTDNSVDILKQYAKKDKRIKVLSQKHSGLSVARNTGLENISGKYVSFIDSDDWIDHNFYEHLLGLIQKDNSDIAVAGIRIVNGDNISDNPTKNFVTNSFVTKIDNLPNGSVCDKLFKSELFRKNAFQPGRFYEDNLVLLESMYNSNIVSFTNQVSYYYFSNMSGICKSTDQKAIKQKVNDRLYYAESMLDFARSHGFGRSKAIKDFIVRTVIADFISKKSPYYAQSKKILGRSYVYGIRMKGILVKIAHFFYQNNSRLRILRIPIYTWRNK